VNSGSIVAGIVGTKKFAYDIWGDTVNASHGIKLSYRENQYFGKHISIS
jgi:hypothetical protein